MAKISKVFSTMIATCKAAGPIQVAVVNPTDLVSLSSAVEGFNAGIITPILIGDSAKIAAIATTHSLDISYFRMIEAATDHEAAEIGVKLAKDGTVKAIMKGNLHTDVLMAEVVRKDTGIRTSRRISHVFMMDVPTYHKPLFITDAAINITPTLLDKADIAQNAIDFAFAMGVAYPKVAIVCAVETVSSKMPSTIDAACLCKMADRGQISGALLDGPLAFDNAISKEAAETKGIVSDVAGDADILLVPDLQAGNMLAKELSFLVAGVHSAGLVLGASVPIILTSRADSLETRLASCAVAAIYGRKM